MGWDVEFKICNADNTGYIQWGCKIGEEMQQGSGIGYIDSGLYWLIFES